MIFHCIDESVVWMLNFRNQGSIRTNRISYIVLPLFPTLWCSFASMHFDIHSHNDYLICKYFTMLLCIPIIPIFKKKRGGIAADKQNQKKKEKKNHPHPEAISKTTPSLKTNTKFHKFPSKKEKEKITVTSTFMYDQQSSAALPWTTTPD